MIFDFIYFLYILNRETNWNYNCNDDDDEIATFVLFLLIAIIFRINGF